MMAFLFVLILYLIPGVLAYGFTFGYFQRKYPELACGHRYADAGFAAVIASLGPLGLIGALCECGSEYGLLYRYEGEEK